jgi:hypothetical protein
MGLVDERCACAEHLADAFADVAAIAIQNIQVSIRPS